MTLNPLSDFALRDMGRWRLSRDAYSVLVAQFRDRFFEKAVAASFLGVVPSESLRSALLTIGNETCRGLSVSVDKLDLLGVSRFDLWLLFQFDCVLIDSLRVTDFGKHLQRVPASHCLVRLVPELEYIDLESGL